MKKTIVVEYEVADGSDNFYDYFHGDHEAFVERLIEYLKVCDPGLTIHELFLSCVDNNVIDGPGLMAMAGRSFHDIVRMVIRG